MDKVYFLKDFKKFGEATEKLLKNFYTPNSEILIKLHFGESGNQTAFFPEDVRPVIETLKKLTFQPTFIDTPVAYDSPRNSVNGYREVVKERGWENLAPFIISETFKEIKTKDFSAQVCSELVSAQNVLVLSHVKGHACSGFGGAIKNLGMGGLAKESKGIIHALSKPKLIKKCHGCGTCAKLCPAGAIKMINNKAEFDLDACWGCSICEISCPNQVLAPQRAYFDDLLAQGASAVINNLPPKTYYINVVKNLTKFCDCEIDSGEIIAQDLGILFSENPVALDKATIDLINQTEGKEVFWEINHKDPLLHVKYASEYTGKSWDYELISLAN